MKGKYLEALECYEKAIKCEPKNAHRGKGNVLRAWKKNREGLDSIEEALKLAPEDAEVNFAKERILQALRQALKKHVLV